MDDAQKRHYEAMVASGESPRLAEMLATRSFPGTKGTDRAFMQGRALGGAQFQELPDYVGRDYVQKALAAGVNPTGKWYSGTLARFPGDPEAWVDSLGDLRKRAESRGWGVQGAITVPPQESPPALEKPYQVAEEILERAVAERLAEHPESSPDLVRQELSASLSGRTRSSGRIEP